MVPLLDCEGNRTYNFNVPTTMATKRPHPSVHPSRQEQVPSEPSRKKRKPNLKASAPGAKTFKKAHPVNELKSRVRSLRRQLERNDGLSAVVQQEKERALRAAEDELERNQRAKQRSDMIGKWHKVRFFDRRKAEKRVKKAKKEVQDSGDGEAGKKVLEQKVKDAEVDVQYAVYYPLEKDYVPLFPRKQKGSEDDDEDVGEVERKGDPVMWETVKRCMADGTLDALRNGRLEGTGKKGSGPDAGRSTKKRPKTSSKVADNGDQAESDDEGGTGFWE